MRAVDHWRKVRTLTGYLAGRVQQLFDQASVRGGRWVMDSGQTLKSAIDEEFKRYESGAPKPWLVGIWDKTRVDVRESTAAGKEEK